MKQIFSIVLALTCTVVAWAQNNVITYTANEKLAEVTSTAEGGIHTNAFDGLTITSHDFNLATREGAITFSGDVTTVGSWAFSYSAGLTSITLPEGVTSIGVQAFAFCTALKSLTIPKNVTSIGNRAFGYSGLESLAVAEGNTTYKMDGNCLIRIADNTLVKALKNSVIPSYVKTIGACAFENRTDLTSFTIPNGVATIEYGAFSNCKNLTSVAIPGSVTSIDFAAFANCEALTSITIPGSVTYIGTNAFNVCKALTSVTVEATTPAEMFTWPFNYCAEDLKVIVPAKSLAAYKAAEGWSEGADQIEITPVAIDATNFPDDIFRAFVTENIDTDKDGQLNTKEIVAAKSIDVHEAGIGNLQGIEYFTALTELNCSTNQLTALDISNCTALKTVYCSKNQLTALDISKNTALVSLACDHNQIATLDVKNNTGLNTIYCSYNQLTAIDLSNNTMLEQLLCNENKLTALDLSYNTNITYLACEDNQLTALDLGSNTKLKNLYCDLNKRDMGEVDVKGFTVEGLDMSKVTVVSGAIVDTDDKFVPSDKSVTEITYTYDTQWVKADKASQTFKLKVTPVDTPTAITAPAAEKAQKAVKVIENGEIVIIKGGKKFNLRGAKIE